MNNESAEVNGSGGSAENGTKGKPRQEAFGFELEERVIRACRKQLERLPNQQARMRVARYIAEAMADLTFGGGPGANSAETEPFA